MISPAIILANYLIAQTTFTDPADNDVWPLYISSMPDGKNVESDVGTIYDSTGLKDGRLMTGENILHFGIQVRIRAANYNDGYNQALIVTDLFEAIDKVTVTVDSVDYFIQSVTQSTVIVPLGPEENSTKRQELFTVNFLATIKEV